MTYSAHPGTLRFQSLDAEFPFIAAAFAGGIASVAVAFAHTPPGKTLPASAMVRAAFSANPEKSSGFDGGRTDKTAMDQSLAAKPGNSRTNVNRLAAIGETAPSTPGLRQPATHTSRALKSESHGNGGENLAVRFDLPLASSPVGTIRRTAPIASPDRAQIAFTLPDVEIEQPFKQPAGATPAPPIVRRGWSIIWRV